MAAVVVGMRWARAACQGSDSPHTTTQHRPPGTVRTSSAARGGGGGLLMVACAIVDGALCERVCLGYEYVYMRGSMCLGKCKFQLSKRAFLHASSFAFLHPSTFYIVYVLW